jgi:hypothetical protein
MSGLVFNSEVYNVISETTGTRKNAVREFVERHKLNAYKLAGHLVEGNSKTRVDFVVALINDMNIYTWEKSDE